ncbi:hypothetical protein CMV_017617 [Castanea mollissima]|uniref:Uncharacterized protein n=1 Tax=Castanea mollissima TaxID=60419 RepID=A0A8J4R3B9_9ROSI|nr:hypothetical protein CMV_017617 [Castanea mollissima]
MEITYTTLMIHNWPQPALNQLQIKTNHEISRGKLIVNHGTVFGNLLFEIQHSIFELDIILYSVLNFFKSDEKILKLLFNHFESEEEGVSNVETERLGKIALIEPEKLVTALKGLL